MECQTRTLENVDVKINTNVNSLIALNSLSNANSQLSTTLNQLSTGLAINSAADNPAGLVAGDQLQSQIGSISAAINNNNQANAVLSTADSALGQIGNLLNNIQGLLTSSSNTGALSQQEIAANQASIDSAISSINQIAAPRTSTARTCLTARSDSNCRVSAVLTLPAQRSRACKLIPPTSMQTAMRSR